MKTDAEVLAQIDETFGGVAKPEHFTNFAHCEECAEHDETLRTHDRDTLLISHVGNPGWDPLAFSSPQGKAYYMPTLARFALSPPTYEYGWFGGQLLLHLYADGANNALIEFCSVQQRVAVASLLQHFIQTRVQQVEALTSEDELLRAHEIWTETAGPAYRSSGPPLTAAER